MKIDRKRLPYERARINDILDRLSRERQARRLKARYEIRKKERKNETYRI